MLSMNKMYGWPMLFLNGRMVFLNSVLIPADECDNTRHKNRWLRLLENPFRFKLIDPLEKITKSIPTENALSRVLDYLIGENSPLFHLMDWYSQGRDSVQTYRLTSIGNPIGEIKRS